MLPREPRLRKSFRKDLEKHRCVLLSVFWFGEHLSKVFWRSRKQKRSHETVYGRAVELSIIPDFDLRLPLIDDFLYLFCLYLIYTVQLIISSIFILSTMRLFISILHFQNTKLKLSLRELAHIAMGL
jgi:hypothetical protein